MALHTLNYRGTGWHENAGAADLDILRRAIAKSIKHTYV
jgi:hypothetical protein